MLSLAISSAVRARPAKKIVNALAVVTVLYDMPTVPVSAWPWEGSKTTASALFVSRDGSALRAVDKSEVLSPSRLDLLVPPALPVRHFSYINPQWM